MSAKSRISVSYLTNGANGSIKQVKRCKLNPSARLQLFNIHSMRYLIKNTSDVRIFTKVNHIKDTQQHEFKAKTY